MLCEAGILDVEERDALHAAIDAIGTAQAAPADHPAEDLHTWVEAELTRCCGEAGKKIHTARSRNDQVATLLQMYLVERGTTLRATLDGIVRLAADRALACAEVELPFQTHAQFAAPGSAGSWMLRHAHAFERDRRALAFWLTEWKAECALGAGAVAGSSIPIDRRRQAELLGFDGPAPNALDATSRRDELLQFFAWASQLGLHLQCLATDLLGFAQTPFGWLRPMPGLMTGSSMMPNKANPDAMELLRGEAGALHGAHVEALTLIKGLPSGYNRDLQCLKPRLHETVERVERLLTLTAAIVEAIEFDTDAIARTGALGDIQATLRMERRVLDGTPLREAHHLEADGAHTATDLGMRDYRTAGSASPGEVERDARRLLER